MQEKKQKRHRFCSDFYAYDLLITNQLLYRLSYTSNSNSKADYS